MTQHYHTQRHTRIHTHTAIFKYPFPKPPRQENDEKDILQIKLI